MKIKSKMKQLATLGLSALLVSAAPATALANGLGYSLPGIVPSSLPNFENSVNVRVIQMGPNGSMVLATGNDGPTNVFNHPVGSYDIMDPGFLLQAKFDVDGNLKSGRVQVTGSIDGHFGTASGRLMTASLGDPYGFDGIDFNFNDVLMGFDTHDIKCHSLIICTEAESVFLSLDDGGFNGLGEKYQSSGLAITSVPVPAAALLFGSGLVGLTAVARRRKNAVTA